MIPAIISLSDIHFSYNGHTRTLFSGLSLDVLPGTVTAILGPNGAGKTTLLHLILGILVPSQGTVLLAQRPRNAYSRREVGKLVGLVLQNEVIPFNFTVLEYVLLGRAPYLQMLQIPGPDDLRVAESALEQVGMTHMRQRSIQALSGGERQLVMVARALAQQPRILLLDEPTSHLDLGNKGRVLSIMQQLAAQGVTVVFTTHEPDLAASVAQFAVLMRYGTTLASGSMDQVFTTDNLTQTYDAPVQVIEVMGRRMVLPPYPTTNVGQVANLPPVG
ncbi:MAG: ABC transporter ATP-binding protein [Anaerolineae bacterium]|nr:ABC transporter ATP-binding protein [Anaerolineae bacterium]